MHALTLWEPWATLISIGAKRFETRSWAPPAKLRGQRIAIHAARRWTNEQSEAAEQFASQYGDQCGLGNLINSWRFGRNRWKPPTLGMVLCTVRLEAWWTVWPGSPLWDETAERIRPESIREARLAEFAFGDFRRGRYAWELDARRVLDPTPAEGKQGFWKWDG